jgi:hypothetical protein
LKAVGLTLGTVTTRSNATVAAGVVSSSNPVGGGTVSPGSAVSLELSSGPGLVAVPDVVGLTRPAAETTLKNAGLVVGAVKTQHSNQVPASGISNTNPDAGTLVSPGSAVELELSSGPEPNWTQYIPTGLFALLGIIVLGVIVYVVTQDGQRFLYKLANKEVARGLITFLIAITTVGIAIILAISTLVLTEGDAGDKRFDRGKQVLSVLIGVLGTIVGFYFGSAPDAKQAQSLAITTTALPGGVANMPYPATTLMAVGGTPPYNWSVTPSLPADLVLDALAGTITGTSKSPLPKTKLTFTVTDSAIPAASSATVDLTLEIASGGDKK